LVVHDLTGAIFPIGAPIGGVNVNGYTFGIAEIPPVAGAGAVVPGAGGVVTGGAGATIGTHMFCTGSNLKPGGHWIGDGAPPPISALGEGTPPPT